MTNYTEFFLNSPSNIVQLELLELSHPNFTQTYYIVRNAVGGITATIDGTPIFFEYRPVRITPISSQDDLDQSLKIDIGDLGEILPLELDSVSIGFGFLHKPKLRYWAFRSDDLSTPMLGPLNLEIVNFVHTAEGCAFEAKAQSLNTNRTGELYRIPRFPMLSGLI